MPKRWSLPSRFGAVHARGVHRGRRVDLGGVDERDRDDEQRHHRREHRPALAAAADHAAVGGGEPGGDHEDHQHLDEVREPRRVLERHRRVDVEEAAAVGAEQLDRLLRGDGPLGERLLEPGEGLHRRGGVEVLQRALGEQEQAGDHRQRQQDVEQDAGEVDVEVPQLLRGARRQPADEGRQHGDADGGGGEVLHRQAEHLREVGHRRLAGVELPVRVRDERRGGVERHVPGRRGEVLRVERVDPLGAQDEVEQRERERAEDEDGARVGLPVLAALAPHAEQPVDGALDEAEGGELAGEHARHVAADQRRQRGEDREEERDLEPAGDGHVRTAPGAAAPQEVGEQRRRRPRARRSPRRSCALEPLEEEEQRGEDERREEE